MVGMNRHDLLSAYADLDSSSVSDALDSLGLTPGIGGIRPQWRTPRVVGFAVTVHLEPREPGAPGAHIVTSAVDTAGEADVIVVANGARDDVSCWGGLLSLGASLRGVRGVVADGVCRDLDEARDLGFPVFSRGTTPATARERLQQRSAREPIDIAGTTVCTGDIVVADATGIAFVPAERAVEVLTRAQAIAAREHAIARDLRAGALLSETMRDARLAGEQEVAR
jgi:regulator of RNase E activity RraA